MSHVGRPSFGDVEPVPDIAEEDIYTHRTDEREARRAATARARTVGHGASSVPAERFLASTRDTGRHKSVEASGGD